MPGTALTDVVVLELAAGVSGPYCGRLLADLGAQVVKLEPPGGDPARREWPLVDGESAFFAWLNAGKLGAAMPPADPRLDTLAAHADIIVHSERGPAADALEARLVAANPRAVVLSLSPYGRSGPRSNWQATSFTEWATGGYHYFGGDPAREPIALPGHQAEFHAGVHAAIAALGGLWHVRNGGDGQPVEIAHQESVLNDHAWLTASWTHQGQVQRRTGSTFVRCADGFVFLFHLAPYPNLFLLIDRLDFMEDESLQVPTNWWARFPEIHEALTQWAATRTKQEVYHAAQELRIAMSPVNTMADVAANQQLAARDSLGAVMVAGQQFVAPGFPYHLKGTPCAPPGPAPKPGEHTAAVTSPAFRWANATVAPVAPASSGRLPLEGIRVLECTANWAGPIGGRQLADLGAEVIKVELATKPATRSLAWVGGDMWPEHYHRAGYFNKLNRNKKAICLDLSKPGGRQAFLDLVARSDVVLENNAARVMANLGLAYDTLSRVNPRIIMCSMSGYGASGPERDYSAYGSNIETASGLASLLGYGPGEYFGTGSFYADPVTGNHGAVALLAALHARQHTGRGQWIDMALLEAALPFFAQHFLDYSVTGRVPEPMGNRSPVHSPQDVYPSAGTDMWLALSVRDEQDWRALCRVIERADLAADPALATVAGRRRAAGRIDAAIAEWSRPRDHNAAANALQAAGLPAAPVMANWEIFTDNHLNDRDYFVRVRHESAGTLHYPGFPFRFEKTPARIRMAAPMFAEHNREVFAGLLGMSDAQIAALYEEGATSDSPRFAAGPSL